MEGLTDSLVTRAGKARLATPELVGQEGGGDDVGLFVAAGACWTPLPPLVELTYFWA
jgi:hypothetical protein